MKKFLLISLILFLVATSVEAKNVSKDSLLTQYTNEQVRTHIKKNIKNNPDKCSAYLDLGNYFFDKSLYPRAFSNYQKAARMDPNSDKAYAHICMYYVSAQDYNQAIESCKKALEINPDNAFAYYNLGDAYNFKGQQDQAVEYYQSAIQLKHPRPDHAYNQIGNAYSLKENYEKAIEYYKKALEIDPFFTIAKANLLVAESKLKKLSEQKK